MSRAKTPTEHAVRSPTEIRFWSHVRVGTADECWPWNEGRGRGYGTFHLQRGKVVRAHRQAYLYANGPVPAGLSVLHRCDNPPCCNPSHLFAGTARDNMNDAIQKGRWKPRPTIRTPEELEHRAEIQRRQRASTVTSRAVDGFMADLETLLIALSQRTMTSEQVDRLAMVLQRGERDLLARCTTSPAKARTRRPAAVSRSSSSGKAEAA